MVAVPVLPSLVAVIVAVPDAFAVTTPLCDTLAIAVLLVDQAIARPVRTLFAASRVVAVSVPVPPTCSGNVVGETVTVATGTGVTVIVAVPVFPSLVAVIVAEPGATAVTVPLGSTVATPVFPELHVTTRPVSTLFDASRVVATSVPV